MGARDLHGATFPVVSPKKEGHRFSLWRRLAATLVGFLKSLLYPQYDWENHCILALSLVFHAKTEQLSHIFLPLSDAEYVVLLVERLGNREVRYRVTDRQTVTLTAHAHCACAPMAA